MKRSRFSEEQVAYALRWAESGTPVVDVQPGQKTRFVPLPASPPFPPVLQAIPAPVEARGAPCATRSGLKRGHGQVRVVSSCEAKSLRVPALRRHAVSRCSSAGGRGRIQLPPRAASEGAESVHVQDLDLASAHLDQTQ